MVHSCCTQSYSPVTLAVLRDKMNCTVCFVNCFLLALPRQHGTRQQGCYISGTLKKQFPNLNVHFILSLSMFSLASLTKDTQPIEHVLLESRCACTTCSSKDFSDWAHDGDPLRERAIEARLPRPFFLSYFLPQNHSHTSSSFP